MEIISRSAASLQGVTTLHFSAKIDGSINAGAITELTGGSSSGLSGNISLNGMTIDGDFDIARQAFRMSLSMPTLMGMTADIIQVDGYQYMQMSLVGPKYTKTKVTTTLVSAAPSATPNIGEMAEQLRKGLTDMGGSATLTSTENVSGQDAYRVKIDIPVAKLNEAIAGAAGSSDITLDSFTLDYWVYMNDLKPAKAVVTGSSPKLGNINATVTLSKYNESVSIQAPSADKIQ
jgi:hypothetical protein